MRSVGGSSPLPSTPCYAPTRRTPRPQRRTCNGRPFPRQWSSSDTAPTNTCSMQPFCPEPTKPTCSNSCSTNRENLPHGTPPNTEPPPPLNTIHRARPLACAHRQPPLPHATVCPQVPPTASHRMPPLRTPAATTNGPTLQPTPLNLPGSCRTPRPLPPLRGPQLPPLRAARGPSRNPAPPATPASSGHSATPSGTTSEGTTLPQAAHPCPPTAHPYATAGAA